ncbi:DHH family phosphoesterase [Aquimarina agarivorans]|uniref:DHH family phosphoesterase n=1 Tax=Aquimarina agarivorans TaxID=980584 RepID=UPI0002E785ED|nr:bifunctional oligoribonuclease/PAP phosphatase NrnA [Aquimarina agarivorans]
MKMKNIKGLKAELASSQNIIIIPHKNPDGDAMGSTLALYSYLMLKQKKSTVITPNDYPSFLKWLPCNNDVLVYENNGQTAKKLIAEADLIFTLDFNHLGRCGDLQELLEANKKASFVMIDHHQQPDDYAKYMYSDPAMCSTCEMVYHFIDQMQDIALINKDIATCLYTGIMTDTGSFRYRSTTSTTHRVIANLIDAGAENTQIHEGIYDTNTLSKLQLKGVALKNLRLFPEYRTAYISLSQKELNDHNFKKGDTEGFVNIGLSIDNILFAVIFIENENEGIIKMSFRSKGSFSVNQFARNHFEGGGHDNAAGGKSDLPLNETIDKFMSILPVYKKELLNS